MKKINSRYKWLLSYTGLYIVLVLLFTTSIISIQLIPRSSIETNLKKSVDLLKSEGLDPQYGPSPYFKLDTFTDALTFDMLYTTDSDNPVEAGLLNFIYEDFGSQDKIKMLDNIIKGNTDNLEYYSYSRNWHGTQIINRPLLLLTDFGGIRIFYGIVMAFLVVLICYLMWIKISPIYSICFLFTFGIMNLFIMPLCLQYNICLDIAMLGMISFLVFPILSSSLLNSSLSFFTIGALCNFFDWFTIPQLTFGLPLIVYYALLKDKKPLKILAIMGAAWFAGYGIMLITKWTIGTLLTDYNCFDLAFKTVNKRMSQVNGTNEYTLFKCLKILSYPRFYTGIVITMIVANLFVLFSYKERWISFFKEYYYILLMALFTPIWFIIIRNHSFVHYHHFVWRAMFLTYYSIILFTALLFWKKYNRIHYHEYLSL